MKSLGTLKDTVPGTATRMRTDMLHMQQRFHAAL